jgi:hypothetical protein
MEAIINCTPHDCHLYDKDGTTVIKTFPASGNTVRLKEERGQAPDMTGTAIGAYPVVAAPSFTGVEGLPDDKTGTIIVSMPVGQYIQTHPDLWLGTVVGPDSGNDGAVRDKGQILGTKRFVIYKAPILK